MAGAFIQSWRYHLNSGTQTGATCVVSGATANNLLIGVATLRLSSSSPAAPTGWTKLGDAGGGNHVTAYYRIASGDSNDNLPLTWGGKGEPKLIVAEYSGLDSVSPLDSTVVSASGSGVTSIQAGATTPSSQPGSFISVLGATNANSWGGTSIDVGTKDVDDRAPYGYDPATFIGKLNYTSTAAINPTWSTAGSGGNAGVIQMCFKEPGGGATNLTPTSIASLEAFGSHTISPGAVTLSPSSISSAEAFGTASLAAGISLSPSAIDSAEAFGSVSLTAGAVGLTPAGIASLEAFGSASITTGVVYITPAGISSAEAFGSHALTSGASGISPTGIASAEAFGSVQIIVGSITIAPVGIASDEAFGLPAIAAVITLLPSGIESLESFGNGVLSIGAVEIIPASIESLEAFGIPGVDDGVATTRPRWFLRQRGKIIGTLTPTSTNLTHRNH